MANKELIMKVLEDITIKLTSQDLEYKKYSKTKRHNILVLFTGSNLEINQVLDNLKILIENGYLLTLCFSKAAEEIIGTQKALDTLKSCKIYLEKDKTSYSKLVKLAEVAIVPVLTANTLAKVAVGIQDSFISSLLWQLLWDNRKVFVNLDSAIHNHLAYENKKMLELINSYVERLRGFGGKIIRDHNYLTYIKKEFDTPTIDSNKLSNRVITEKDILNLVGTTKELVISKDAIITPLAKDTAKDNGINIFALEDLKEERNYVHRGSNWNGCGYKKG